jgi:hypothetical protein
MRQSNRRKRGITAWLVTWDHIGDHAKPPTRIAAILNPRWSSERVREIVEILYVNSNYCPSERIGYAKNKSFNPYPAEFDRLRGVPWLGRIFCGHNPFLYARVVDNLVAPDEGFDETQVTWDERPRPDEKKIAELLGEKSES